MSSPGRRSDHDLDVDDVLAYCHGRLTHATVDHFLPHLPAAERDRLADDLLAGEVDRHDGGVEVPVVTVTSDDVTHGKSHPEPYLRGAELLGVPIEQCLVLEDADAGIVAGLTAGARVLVVGTHESPTTEGLPRAVDLTDVTVGRDGDEIVVEVAMAGLEATGDVPDASA